MMTITEFCDRHGACREGREWALDNCHDLPHAWETIRPDWLVWMATRRGVLDNRTLRRFAVWSARQVQDLMTDPRSIAALDVAERYAEGQATNEELLAARDAAEAVWVAGAAARAAALDAAEAASEAAAEAAAGAAAEAAAGAAARAAARDAGYAAAQAAAETAAQAAEGAAEWAAEGAAEWAARAARDAARDAGWIPVELSTLAAQAAWLRENATPNWEATP